jgi:hypothetical protein
MLQLYELERFFFDPQFDVTGKHSGSQQHCWHHQSDKPKSKVALATERRSA